MLEILQDTNSDNPKTAKQIADEIEKRWYENENLKNFSFNDNDKIKGNKVSATITRHIHDLNKSGLYEILTCYEKKKGYYNKTGGKNFIFSPAEFAVIAMALYRTPSISTEETKKILSKFKDLIAPEGESFNDFLQNQIEYWKGIRRKPARKILPIISELLKVIYNRRQIKFKMYDRNFSTEQKYVELERRIQKSRGGGIRDKIYTVSPYFFAWDRDECYLVASGDEDKIFGCRYLNRFKVSLMKNLKVTENRILPTAQTVEFGRYFFPSFKLYARPLPNDALDDEMEKVRGKMLAAFFTGKESEELKKFSLDRYMREHIYMEVNESPIIEVTIYFKENFLDEFLTQFTLNQKFEIIPNRKENDKFKYQSRIIVQDNDGLYRWLMQYSDQVKVIRPIEIRRELKYRYEKALADLRL